MSNLPANQGQFDLAVYVDNTIKPKVQSLIGPEKWPAFSVAMMAAVLDKPGLREHIAKNPTSALVAVVKCAQLGLSLNPIDKHFALIPRGGVVHGEPQYQGWVHLAMSSGAIEWVHADVVYKQEAPAPGVAFVDPVTQQVNHVPLHLARDSFKDDDIVAAYCMIKLRGQSRLKTRVLTRGDLNKRRAKGAANSEAWQQHFATMCKGKALKAACSSPDVPKSAAMAQALNMFSEDEHVSVPAVPALPALPAPIPRHVTVEVPKSPTQQLFDATEREPFPSDQALADRLRDAIACETLAHEGLEEKLPEVASKALGRPVADLQEVTTPADLEKVLDALVGMRR